MVNGQTSLSEIVESLRAIKIAAKDRHAALLAEVSELEQAFPDLARQVRVGRPTGSKFSPETRARMSEAAKARWAARTAAGVASVQ